MALPTCATITPNVPLRQAIAASTPHCVAKMRSWASGMPPRCVWPGMPTRTSRPVAAAIWSAMS